MQLDVAKKRVAIEKTQGNIVFNATASAGIQSEYYDQTKPLLQTSLKAQKLLLDNKNLKKSIELLELDVEILGVDTFMEADKKINELTVAYTAHFTECFINVSFQMNMRRKNNLLIRSFRRIK